MDSIPLLDPPLCPRSDVLGLASERLDRGLQLVENHCLHVERGQLKDPPGWRAHGGDDNKWLPTLPYAQCQIVQERDPAAVEVNEFA